LSHVITCEQSTKSGGTENQSTEGFKEKRWEKVTLLLPKTSPATKLQQSQNLIQR
jgi:hypothetical protein